MSTRETPSQRLAGQIAKLQMPIGIHCIGFDRVEYVGKTPLDGWTQFGPPQADRVVVPRKLIVRRRQQLEDQLRQAADVAKLNAPLKPTPAGYLNLDVDKRAKTVVSMASSIRCDFSKARDQWRCFLFHYEAADTGIDVKDFLEEYGGTPNAARQIVLEVNMKLEPFRVRLKPEGKRRILVSFD